MKQLLSQLKQSSGDNTSRGGGSTAANHRASAPGVDQSEPLDHARFWPRMGQFLRFGDFIIADVVTSQFGCLDIALPARVDFFSQSYFSSIGFSVPATLGALQALKETGSERRVILFVGDGSLHMTVQEIGTMARYGLMPIIIVVNNRGYTVERLIHEPEQGYNDISQLWEYQKMLSFFGTPDNGTSDSFSARTYGELGKHS